MPQIELCLNHLQPYKPNPTISAYAGLHGGAHDFRAHPIAPAGTKVLIHDKPSSRGSRAPHGTPDFYLGPANQHYRCYKVWATSTNSLRITDTLAWFLSNLQLPHPSPHELLIAATVDLQCAITRLSKIHPSLIHTGQLSAIPSLTEQLPDASDMHRLTSDSITAPASPIPPLVDHPVVEERVQAPQLHPGDEQRVPIDEPEQIPLVPPLDFLPNPVLHPPPPFDPLPDNVPLVLPPGRVATIPTAPTSRVTRQHSAKLRSFAYASLNLANDNSPLTYSKAKAGPDASRWLQAESEDFDRLFDSRTMHPIHLDRQPYDRRSDTTYLNPQTKQKIDAAGNITFRIRGTAGGDHINYNGPTSAQTAAMAVVKLLIHSVVSEQKNWMTIDIKDYYL